MSVFVWLLFPLHALGTNGENSIPRLLCDDGATFCLKQGIIHYDGGKLFRFYIYVNSFKRKQLYRPILQNQLSIRILKPTILSPKIHIIKQKLMVSQDMVLI